MKNTKIEWCDSTWNPVTGCFHGCEYCYARRIANRFGGFDPSPSNSDGRWNTIQYEKDAERLGVLNSMQVRKQKNGKLVPAPYPFGFTPTLHEYRLEQPQKWINLQTIFVCSMADLFGQWVPDEWIEKVFSACDKAPQHRYIFLTKNPQRLCDLANSGKLPKKDNFWYGSTMDSMKAKRYPGRFRDNTFVSIEPLTERLDVGLGSFGSCKWIIIGAETGNRKGKVVPEKEWIDIICEAAEITNAAVFMKDSLIPIVGEENMRRELPWITHAAKGAAQDVLMPATSDIRRRKNGGKH